MIVKETPVSTNYKLLTITGVNGVAGTYQFDFNLVNGKRLLIKRVCFKWYLIDNSEGVPYLSSDTSIDGVVAGHNVINANAEKVFIPEQSAANRFQNSLCTLLFNINNKPVYLNGKMDNIFLNEDNINIMINEPVQSIIVKVSNAKVILLNGASLVSSENIGWICEIGAYIL